MTILPVLLAMAVPGGMAADRMYFAPKGDLLFCCTDKGLTVIDWKAASVVRTIQPPAGDETEFARSSADGEIVAMSAHNHVYHERYKLHIVEARSGKEICNFEIGTETNFALSADGKKAFYCHGMNVGTVHVINATTGVQMSEAELGASDLDTSSDGKWLAVAGYGGGPRLYNPDKLDRPVRTLKGRGSMLMSIEFSKDGKFILAGGQKTLEKDAAESTAAIWKVEDGSVLKEFETMPYRMTVGVGFLKGSAYVKLLTMKSFWMGDGVDPGFSFSNFAVDRFDHSMIRDWTYSPDLKTAALITPDEKAVVLTDVATGSAKTVPLL